MSGSAAHSMRRPSASGRLDALVDKSLDCRERGAGTTGQHLGERKRAGVQLFRRDHFVYESNAERVLAAHRFATEHQVQRPAHPNQPGQSLRASRPRESPHATLRQSKGDAGGGNPNVAGKREFEAASQREAIQNSDRHETGARTLRRSRRGSQRYVQGVRQGPCLCAPSSRRQHKTPDHCHAPGGPEPAVRRPRIRPPPMLRPLRRPMRSFARDAPNGSRIRRSRVC